jgi:hypothetical protein
LKETLPGLFVLMLTVPLGAVTVALIHPVEGFDEEQQVSCNELKAQFQVSDLKVSQIPRHAPLTPEQFEAQAKLWPTISRFVSQ